MTGYSRTDPRAILEFTGVLEAVSDDFFRASNYVAEWTNVTASPGGFLAELLGTHEEFAASLAEWLRHLGGICYAGSRTLANIDGYYNINDDKAAAALDATLPPATPYGPDGDSSWGQRQ